MVKFLTMCSTETVPEVYDVLVQASAERGDKDKTITNIATCIY